jgi:uncharacterized protein
MDHAYGKDDGATSHSSIVAIVRQHVPDVVAIYVLGSRASGTARPDSDHDVGLVLPPGRTLTPTQRLGMTADLERAVAGDVDVAALDPARSTVLCKEAVASGSRVFTADARATAEFEMMALAMYARLCEDRRPVVAAYTAGSGGG